jgi:hypothetical protein
MSNAYRQARIERDLPAEFEAIKRGEKTILEVSKGQESRGYAVTLIEQRGKISRNGRPKEKSRHDDIMSTFW